MHIKITNLEFDWDFGDHVPPEYELLKFIGKVVEIPESWAKEGAVEEFLTEELIMTCFPIEALEWDVVKE